jgi:hypothetical protein
MASGNMQYGNNGAGNNSGPDFTTLIANIPAPQAALSVENLAGEVIAARGGTVGVQGTADFEADGFGVIGEAWVGVYGRGTADGVFGRSLGGLGGRGDGVYGESDVSSGVRGVSLSGAPTSQAGVFGRARNDNGNGVIGIADNGRSAFGVWGISRTGFAGEFWGNVDITGTLTKPGTAFKIDHPLDPENKYLNHSGVESPDMKNLYDGIERLGEDGSAWIELPKWFGELNRSFRYQLTAIGEAAPNLHIAEEVSDNRFRIGGGTAGMRVSWQVTGIRKDPWAEKNRIPVEEDKPDEARGTYRHPEAFGQPETRRMGYADEEAVRSREAELLEGRPVEPPEPTE